VNLVSLDQKLVQDLINAEQFKVTLKFGLRPKLKTKFTAKTKIKTVVTTKVWC